MSKNALAVLDKGGKLPAHLAKLNERKNIEDRTTVPSLGITGKVFTVAINGEKRKVTKRDPETGDVNPLQTIRAIILDFAPRRGRAYYEGDYNPEQTSAPACWSVDGIKPHDNVPEKQSPKCDGCPRAAKGSKISNNGKSMVACSQHLMLVVLVMGQKGLELTPLRLKLAITSIWDAQSKELQEDGWFAFDQYKDFLRAQNCNNTAMVITKITFDPNEAYPKLIFAADKWVDEALGDAIEPLLDSPEVKELLDATWTPAGVDGKKTEVEQYNGKGKGKPAPDEEDAPAPRRKAAAVAEEVDEDAPRTPRKAAPKIIDGEATEVEDAPVRKRKPVEAEAPAEAPARRRKAVVEEDDEAPAPAARRKAAPVEDGEDDAPAPRRRSKPAEDDAPVRRKAAQEDAPAARSKPKVAAAPVDDLLEKWDDDE